MACIRDRFGEFHQPKFECGCCKRLFFKVCGERHLYRNNDLEDLIFYCLLTSIAAVQAEDVHGSLPFVVDLNGYHQEWLGYTTTNRQGVAAFDFANVSGCDQSVVDQTHASGGNFTS